jgi:hypothetical protein
MAGLPPFRRSAASSLRLLANRLEPVRRCLPARPLAPLVRVGGRWWYRDDLQPWEEPVIAPPSQASEESY